MSIERPEFVDRMSPPPFRGEAAPISNAELQQQILATLNPRQQEAVTYGEGPLLIFAGAGSGKTRVITRRMAWLVLQGVHPAAILAITFTNKAAREMKDRLTQLLGPVARHMWVGTFHSMMLRIIRRHAEVIGFTPHVTILDTDDQRNLLKQIMKDLGISSQVMSVKEVHNLIGWAKNRLLWPDDFAAQEWNRPGHEEIVSIYRAYQNRLREQNSMDFDDILLYAVELLSKHSDILTYYSQRFRYILVDEYQDTNHAQYQLVLLLAGGHRNLCVVGDDDQSIYAFRGADFTNILNFKRDFTDCKVIKLEQNYRSTKTILEAANSVIANNETRTGKKLWTANDQGEQILFYRAADQMDEARFVAREIRRLHERMEKPYGWGDIGVFYRINALSRNLEMALLEAGIPYHISGGLSFYDRMEIRDVFAYLRLLESPDDQLAFSRVVNTPKRGIGNTTMERVLGYAQTEGRNALAICRQADRYPDLSYVAGRLQAFARILDRLQQTMEENTLSFPDFMRQVEVESGLLPYWEKRRDQGDMEAENRMQNLQELQSDALEFASRQADEARQLALLGERYGDDDLTLTLLEESELQTSLKLSDLNRAYLENASLFTNMDPEDLANSVSLMTVHSAKGLEFPVCFLVGLEEDIFPGYRSRESKEEMEEERRLAYVAITRAQEKLVITAARSRLLYGQTTYHPVSPFLAEIPDHTIQELGGSRFGDEGDDTAAIGGADPFFYGRPAVAMQASVGASAPGKPRSSTTDIFKQTSGQKPHSQLRKNTESQVDALADLPLGSQLKHARFGVGTLIKKDPVTADMILSIDFNGKVKHMMASMARLEIMES